MNDPTAYCHSAAPDPPDSDVSARIARLFVYPIKSCAGIELKQSPLHDTGLAHDREWMLVDAEGEFVSQRDLPRMALIRPTFEGGGLLLDAPGMERLRLLLSGAAGSSLQVRVWDDEMPAFDAGDGAADWFSRFLKGAAPPSLQRLRLVRIDPANVRLSSRRWTAGNTAPVLFADGYAMLLASEASMLELNRRLAARGEPAVGVERFRPNLVLAGIEPHDEDRLDELRIDTDRGAEVRLKVVKPCVRCPIPNIDPATALSAPAVGDELQRYRQNGAMGGGVTFGMNAIVTGGAGALLEVGQAVAGNWRFD
ncbi:MAG: MOSC N-terminal beta barrel domain-containing protein [Burkholderiales bacterium]